MTNKNHFFHQFYLHEIILFQVTFKRDICLRVHLIRRDDRLLKMMRKYIKFEKEFRQNQFYKCQEIEFSQLIQVA